MLAIRQAGDKPVDIYRDEFLIERPMLQALRAPDSAVLLLDEIDRSDHEFEALLLEFLSDFTISIPERGTLSARERPVVILTSNRTRELHEALRRRCVYHFITYPAPEREAQIIMLRASSVAEETARAVVAAVGRLRREPLAKPPGISEAVDWAEAATVLAKGGRVLAGCLQALHRRRHQGRGGQRPYRAQARRHHHGGRRMRPAALPDAVAPFVAFATLLRANGFAVAPEQTTAFLSAITLLGPRSLDHIRRAAHATLAPPPERHEEFNALFDAHFLGAVELGREIGRARPGRHARAGGPPRRLRAARLRRHQRGGPGRHRRRGAFCAPLRPGGRDRHPAPLPARAARAPAAAARLSARRGQARPRARPAPRHEGGDPQRRRDLPPAAPRCAACAAAPSCC